MAIRLAIIGDGAVAAIHAAKLRQEPDVQLVSVYGPNSEKASAFAACHGIPLACGTVAEAIALAEAAVICSPSAAHFSQARASLEQGIHTLVEMPPCDDAAQGQELATLAERHGVTLACAHTSRYVESYTRVKSALESGLLGEIQGINYTRYHRLRERSWRDNALLHHSAHPIDLLYYWCGGVEAQGCVALPDAGLPQTVSILGKLPSGGPAAITVSYASRLYYTRMTIVGEKHTVETDGFSYLKSDFPELAFSGDEKETYEIAIHRQDREFLRGCRGKGHCVSWAETLKVLHTMDRFRALAA